MAIRKVDYALLAVLTYEMFYFDRTTECAIAIPDCPMPASWQVLVASSGMSAPTS